MIITDYLFIDYREPDLKNAAAYKGINIMNVILKNNKINYLTFQCQQLYNICDQQFIYRQTALQMVTSHRNNACTFNIYFKCNL